MGGSQLRPSVDDDGITFDVLSPPSDVPAGIPVRIDSDTFPVELGSVLLPDNCLGSFRNRCTSKDASTLAGTDGFSGKLACRDPFDDSERHWVRAGSAGRGDVLRARSKTSIPIRGSTSRQESQRNKPRPSSSVSNGVLR